MSGKRTPARRIDAPLPQTGGDVVLGESVASVAPPAEQTRERPEGLALVPALLRSAVTPEGSIAATWDSPAGLAVDQYVVQISEGSGFADDATTTYHTPRNQPAITIANLKTNTLYYVRVAASARGAQSEWSETASDTTPADTTAPGPVTNEAYDWDGADLLLTWDNPADDNFGRTQIDIYASNGGAALHTAYSTTGSYRYTADQNKVDTAGAGDPSLYVELTARSVADVPTLTVVDLSPTNAAPSTPSVTGQVGFSQIAAWVTSTPPLDFDSYEFAWKNSGGSTVQTTNTQAAQDFYQPTTSDTYSVTVRVKDLFGQYSSGTTVSSLTIDAPILADLRSRIVYSDSLSTAAATLKAALADDNKTSGGISYASNASWVRSIRADWQLDERIKTITLSMTPASGTTNWYVRTSLDGSTWSYFAGPVTSSRILTSVADASAAQGAAVSAATLGGQTTSRVDLPSLAQARYVEVWLRNTAASTRVDEFYPRRLVQSDDIEAESIKAINIAAATITGDRIAANTITAANITAGTITATEIAASTITAAKLSISTLSAITADMGSLTAGSIVIGSSNKIWLNDSSDGALNIGGSTKGSAPFRVTSAGALTATNATITGTVNFGGGEGVLDSTGLNLHAAAASLTLTAARSVVWRQSVPSGTVACYVQGNYDGLNRNILDLISENASGGPGQIQLYAKGTSTGAQIGMIGDVSGNGTSIAATAQDITLTASAKVSVVGDQVISNRLVINGAASDLGTSLVLKGTDSSYSDGPHAEFLTAADAHAQLQILPWAHDNVSLAFDAHFDGTNWKSSDAGSNFRIAKLNDVLTFTYKSGVSAGSNITWADGITMDASGGVTVLNGLNVGSATGAGTGVVKSSGFLQPSNVAVSYGANLLSLANNGTAALGMSNFGFAFFQAGSNAALYAINGSSHTTTEIFDPGAVYTGTAGSASSINVYWSAGNSRYEVENKRGSTLNIRIWLLDAA